MDRVKLSWTLGALSVGIIVALVALPSTNWLLKNVADSLRYGRAGEQILDFYPVLPQNLIDFRLIEGDADAKFIADRDSQDILKDGAEPLIRYAEAHPKDPEIWAETLSSLYLAPMHMRPKPDKPADSQNWTFNHNVWPKYGGVRQAALRVAEHGHDLEPNNGYFAFAVADIAWGMGERTKAAEALEAAARCTEFKDYHRTEGETRLRILERYYGYRGEDGRFDAISRTRLPEYSSHRAFAQEIAVLPHDRAGLLLRLRLLQTANLTEEHCTTVIGMLVSYSMVGIIVRDGKRIDKDIASDPDRVAAYQIAKARDFESALRAFRIPPGNPGPTETVRRLAALVKTVHSHLRTEISGINAAVTPAFSTEILLLGMMFSAVAVFALIGVGAFLSMLPKGAASALLPYLFAIGGCFAIASDHGDFIAPLLITFAVVRCLPGVRKYGHWCNLTAVVALLSLNLTYVNVDAQNLLVAALFGVTWAATTFDFEKAIILVLSGVLIALVVVPVVRGVMFLPDAHPVDYRLVTYSFLVLVAIFPFKRVKGVTALPSIAFAISLLALGYVGHGVVQNNKLRAVFNNSINEVDTIRSEAGTGPRAYSPA